MENEILENGTAPETEVVQETETVVTEPAEAVTEPAAPEKKGNKITEALGKAADKGKELAENPKAVWEKIKAVPKKIWIAIGAGIAAILALVIILSAVTNTYKTPIKLLQAVQNNKKASAQMNKETAQYNGLCEKEFKQIANILKKSETYDDVVDGYEETIEYRKENYGDNYKYKYKIEDKEKLDKDELKDIQKEIRSAGKSYYNAYSDLDSDDYESIAESLDITKAQAKKLASLYKSIGKTLKTAKVTKGYKLTVTRTLTGSELDEPIETELEIYVYKVNGRWISDDAF
ncbi:MAG: hypothetical protein IJE24_05100 [Oscillospiraceae bacterium]|nr:hypothetical protein [Oscillospiraceae bacterium]